MGAYGNHFFCLGGKNANNLTSLSIRVKWFDGANAESSFIRKNSFLILFLVSEGTHNENPQ